MSDQFHRATLARLRHCIFELIFINPSKYSVLLCPKIMSIRTEISIKKESTTALFQLPHFSFMLLSYSVEQKEEGRHKIKSNRIEQSNDRFDMLMLYPNIHTSTRSHTNTHTLTLGHWHTESDNCFTQTKAKFRTKTKHSIELNSFFIENVKS